MTWALDLDPDIERGVSARERQGTHPALTYRSLALALAIPLPSPSPPLPLPGSPARAGNGGRAPTWARGKTLLLFGAKEAIHLF